MRVVEKIENEKFIACPECKRLLAYTENDIRTSIKRKDGFFKISSYIDCPICGYSNLICYQEKLIAIKE